MLRAVPNVHVHVTIATGQALYWALGIPGGRNAVTVLGELPV